MELLQQRVEPFPVLGKVYTVCGGAEYTNALLIKISAELYCRLSAECDYHAVRLFDIDNVLHVFRRKTLKIEPVGSVEVRGYGFGVVVNYNYFVAKAF